MSDKEGNPHTLAFYKRYFEDRDGSTEMSDCKHTWKQTETRGTFCSKCDTTYQRPKHDWERITALESAVEKVVEIEKRVRQGAPKYRTTEPELGRAIDELSALLGVQT